MSGAKGPKPSQVPGYQSTRPPPFRRAAAWWRSQNRPQPSPAEQNCSVGSSGANRPPRSKTNRRVSREWPSRALLAACCHARARGYYNKPADRASTPESGWRVIIPCHGHCTSRKEGGDGGAAGGAGDGDDGPVKQCSREAAAGAEAPPTNLRRRRRRQSGQEEE